MKKILLIALVGLIGAPAVAAEHKEGVKKPIANPVFIIRHFTNPMIIIRRPS